MKGLVKALLPTDFLTYMSTDIFSLSILSKYNVALMTLKALHLPLIFKKT